MSVLERRASCPGSMRMEAGRPDTPSIYAKRGNQLHAVAAACLTEDVAPDSLLEDDPDGIEIVTAYVDQVRAAHGRIGGQLLVEQSFRLEALHALYWGTADAVIVRPPWLWVCDLKTGGGHPVPIRRPDGRVNFQLGGYALGALQSLPPGLGNTITSIELCVVQPRLGPPQVTTMDLADIQNLAADLIGIAEAAVKPDMPLVPGEHCSFCRARGDCPALRAVALEAAGHEFDVVDLLPRPVVPPPPQSLTPLQLSQVLTAADIVDTWLHGVRVHAKQLADHGTPIPDWKLVNKIGRRIWAVDPERALESLDLPLEDRYVIKPVSPPQAEKALRRLKLKKPDDWNDIITMSDPGTALVPAADRRPAVAPRLVEFDIEPNETD
jgi:hypothetical protein